MQDLEQAIRERAYQLWIDGGRQHGNAEAHWLVAQREILSAAFSMVARVTASRPRPSKSDKLTKASQRKRSA